MAGIEKIQVKIIEQAQMQAQNRVNYAVETAEKAKSDLKRRFDRTVEAEKVKASAEGDEAAHRVIATVMLEGRKKKLAAKQEAVSTVFEKVAENFAELPETEYVEFLGGMALSVLIEGENELILNEKDNKAVGVKLIDYLKKKDSGINVFLSSETIKTAGGLIVKNGYIQTNFTLESIIRVERERLETDVVKILFESE